MLVDRDERFLNEYINQHGGRWETVVDNGKWVFIHEFSLPDGYTKEKVSLAILFMDGYPQTGLDSFYIYPPIQRRDSVEIPNIQGRLVCGKNCQYWSRHRKDMTPWRPEIDSLETHIDCIEEWLRGELKR